MSILFSHFFAKNNEISPLEADFTEVLSTIAVMPKTLYFYGNLPKNVVSGGRQRRPCLAIVGTRKPTPYGRKIAYELAYAAAQRGAVVISGLAYGIDSIAHQAALDAGGTTVAVLGTPIDQIYPRAHLELAAKIVQNGGAILSEIPAGARINQDYFPKTSFLQRNRLISGLSDVVMIPEAARRSGSLNTAAHALEQGKDIFAAPGNLGQPMSEGCNRLIAKGGAMPYLETRDVLEQLFPADYRNDRQSLQKTAKNVPLPLELPLAPPQSRSEVVAGSQRRDTALQGDTPVETLILASLAKGLSDGAQISAQNRLSSSDFSQAITMLEIKGLVRALGMNHWALR